MLSELDAFPCVDTPKEAFIRAGILGRDLKSRGFDTPVTDCLIAATAMAYDCVLVTADKHFERFSDLKLLLLE